MEPPVTRLYLIRHGEVEESYHRIFGGRIDMGLSPKGTLQATAVADYFDPVALDAVYCSPMKRAQLTAQPLLEQKTMAATTIEELREVDFGDWTGHHWEEITLKFGVSAFTWLEQLEQDNVPAAESGATLRARVNPVIDLILEKHPGESVAIVCHGGVIRLILSHLLKIPLPLTVGLEIDYCSVNVADFRDGRAIVQLLNHTPWRLVL